MELIFNQIYREIMFTVHITDYDCDGYDILINDGYIQVTDADSPASHAINRQLAEDTGEVYRMFDVIIETEECQCAAFDEYMDCLN